jgi:hypothetical protein
MGFLKVNEEDWFGDRAMWVVSQKEWWCRVLSRELVDCDEVWWSN